MYRTPNAQLAADWEVVLTAPEMGRTNIALAPTAQQVVYALSASNVPGPGGNYEQALHAVFRSSAGGDPGSWTTQVTNANPNKLNTVLLHNATGATASACDPQATDSYTNMGWYTNVIEVDPRDPNRLFVAGVHLFRSDDAGRNWGAASFWFTATTNRTPIHVDNHALVFHPGYDGASNQTFYLVGDGGVYRTDNARARTNVGPTAACTANDDGLRWVDLNNGYGPTQFYHGLPFPDGRSYLGGTQDNGTNLGSDRAGFNGWGTIFGGDGSYSAIDPRNPNVLYVQYQWAQVWKSVDRGRHWRSARNGLDPAITDLLGTNTNYVFITPLLMDPSLPQRLWLGGRRMWRTNNGAFMWRPASRELKGLDKVSAISIADTDSDLVVAGSDTGRLYRTTRGRTSNASTAWPSRWPRRAWVTSVEHDPDDPRTVYATYGNFGGKHVYRSRNGGGNWRSIDGSGKNGIPDIPVHSVLVDPDDSRRIYLGTDLGVFVSTNGGAIWAVENTGFGAVVTESLSIVKTAGGTKYLFAFTHGRGAWRVKIPESD